MAVVALASWAAKQGSGFATDELTGAVIGIGDYRRALVQAGAAVLRVHAHARKARTQAYRQAGKHRPPGRTQEFMNCSRNS